MLPELNLLELDENVERNKTVGDGDALLVAQAIGELPYVTTAYEELMRRHYALIHRTCVTMLRDASEAEDISQLVLIKVFNGLPKFRGRARFKTWLLKVTSNCCLTRLKKRKQ